MAMFNLTGWKDIYLFTFIQTLKNKSFKVSFVILCILAAAAMPCAALLSGNAGKAVEESDAEDAPADGSEKNITEVEAIYLYYDNSDTALDRVINEWENEYKCEYLHSDMDVLDSKRADINTDNTYALLSVYCEDGLYSVDMTVGWEVMDEDKMGVLDDAVEALGKRLESLQLENISPGIVRGDDVEVYGYIGESEENYSDSFNFLNYLIQLGYIMIFVFILSFSGERIATSVVTEKAGKMVEFLMISVRPMAILAGKVLAVISTVLIQVFAMIICGVASSLLCNVFFGNMVSDYLLNNINSLNSTGMALSVNPLSVMFAALFVIGGLLFYSLAASLAGASVSKIEEVSEGMVIVTFMLIIGAYMAMGLGMNLVMGGSPGKSGIYETLTYMLPLSSPFSVPQNLMTGYIGYGRAIVSLVLLYAAVAALIVLSSKVYEFMLFYNGAKLGVKDIAGIAMHQRVKGEK